MHVWVCVCVFMFWARSFVLFSFEMKGTINDHIYINGIFTSNRKILIFVDGLSFMMEPFLVLLFFFCWRCCSVTMVSILMWIRCRFLPLLLLLHLFSFFRFCSSLHLMIISLVLLHFFLIHIHFHSYCSSRFSFCKMVYFIGCC